MKKTLLASILLILLYSVAIGDERVSGLYTYEIKGNGTAIITKYTHKFHEDINIPNMIDGYLVTEIGDNAFSEEWGSSSYQTELSITLPDSITSIGKRAFFAVKANSINIPNSVMRIGEGALTLDSKDIRFILSPDHPHFTLIDGNLYNKDTKSLVTTAFHNNSTYNIEGLHLNIPDGIVSIDGYALYKTLFSLEFFPTSIRSIGDYSFAYATDKNWYKTSSFDISNVTDIGKGAFRGYTGWFGGTHSGFDPTGDHILTVPKEIQTLNDWSFANTSLGNVIFHDNVQNIGDYSFYSSIHQGDYSDTTLLIPSSVKRIGNYAFASSSFASLAFANGVEEISAGAFQSSRIRDITFPKSLKQIGDYAFSGIQLEKGIFRYQGNLTNVTIVGTDLSIGKSAFEGQDKLTTVIIDEGVRSIGENAFAECNGLKDATISQSVNLIGRNAFDKKNVTLHVYKDSYAELWAKENGVNYDFIGEPSSLDWLFK